MVYYWPLLLVFEPLFMPLIVCESCAFGCLKVRKLAGDFGPGFLFHLVPYGLIEAHYGIEAVILGRNPLFYRENLTASSPIPYGLFRP